MDLYTEIFAWSFMIILFLIICINLGIAYYCFYTCKKLINKCCAKKQSNSKVQPENDEKIDNICINPLVIDKYIVC